MSHLSKQRILNRRYFTLNNCMWLTAFMIVVSGLYVQSRSACTKLTITTFVRRSKIERNRRRRSDENTPCDSSKQTFD